MRNCLFVLFFFFGTAGETAMGAAGSREEIRELLRMSPSYQRDSLLITTFRSYWAATNGDEEFILECLEQIGPDATGSEWPPAKAHYFYIRGSEYLRNNQLYSAFDYLERSMLEFKKLEDEKNFGIVNNKFIPLMTWNMYENDIPEQAKVRYSNYFAEAYANAEAIGELEVMANIKITWAGYTLFILKDYKKSLQMADEVLELIRGQDREQWFDYFHITMLGRSLNYLYLGEIRKGEQIMEQVIENCLQRPDFNQANYILGQVAGFGGRYYLSRKQYKKALRLATLAENRSDFMEFPYFANYLNTTLYEAYKYNGHTEEALKYLEKIREYEQRSETEKLNTGLTEWQMRYETEKHKNRIANLENENLLRSKQRNRAIVHALLLISLTGVIATVYIINSNRQLKHKNEELKHKNEEITKAVFKGQAIERKRLASELHDNLNTKIAALKWRVESTEKPGPEELQSFVQILDDIYGDVRLIAHNLIPTDLETVGLIIAIQKLIKNLENHPIEFHFLNKGFSHRLPIDLEYQVYNITLELINNILKHAQATKAWISLSHTGKEVVLTVTDNGIGLEAGAREKGVGLTNIKSRVEQLNGQISLPASSGKGATIHILLPA